MTLRLQYKPAIMGELVVVMSALMVCGIFKSQSVLAGTVVAVFVGPYLAVILVWWCVANFTPLPRAPKAPIHRTDAALSTASPVPLIVHGGF